MLETILLYYINIAGAIVALLVTNNISTDYSIGRIHYHNTVIYARLQGLFKDICLKNGEDLCGLADGGHDIASLELDSRRINDAQRASLDNIGMLLETGNVRQ